MEKKYVRIGDLNTDTLKTYYKEGFKKGYSCGFHNGDELISYKLGYHTLIYAHPFSGKTQFAMQEAIYLSKTYDLIHLVYFPENGRKEEVVGDLLMVYMGQKMYGDNIGYVDIDELENAIAWLDKHFILIAPEDGKITLKEAYLTASDLISIGINISMLWIDHFGYLAKEVGDKSFSMADYVKDSMQLELRAGLKLNIHTVMMAHIRDVEPVTDKDTGKKYMPKPHPSDVAGGQQNWNNGYQMIGIWRAPEGIIDPESGMPFAHNEMHVMVQKSKPKGIGRLGTLKLFFDEDTQRLYEFVGESRYYTGEFDAWNKNKKKSKADDLPF